MHYFNWKKSSNVHYCTFFNFFQAVTALKVVPANSALRIRAILDFDDGDVRRTAGDEWLFEGPGTTGNRRLLECTLSHNLTCLPNRRKLKRFLEGLVKKIRWKLSRDTKLILPLMFILILAWSLLVLVFFNVIRFFSEILRPATLYTPRQDDKYKTNIFLLVIFAVSSFIGCVILNNKPKTFRSLDRKCYMPGRLWNFSTCGARMSRLWFHCARIAVVLCLKTHEYLNIHGQNLV